MHKNANLKCTILAKHRLEEYTSQGKCEYERAKVHFREDEAFDFFQLIAARYEYKPTILTNNQLFSKWPDIFGDAVIANAIIDRLVHHCDIVKITGHSYRIKGRNIFNDTDD